MITTILSATDGSKHAGKALRLAAELAGKFNAKLIVMHVMGQGKVPEELAHMAEVEHLAGPAEVDTTPPRVPIPQGGLQSNSNQKIHVFISDKLVEDAVDMARAKGVKDVQSIVENGDPSSRILETAEKHKVDMIVMGSRGLGNLKGLLVGSVSPKVNHLCPCTCVSVK